MLAGHIANSSTYDARIQHLWQQAERLRNAAQAFCKAFHFLRHHGNELTNFTLTEFTNGLRTSLEAFPKETRVHIGELTFGTPQEVAVAAFVTSRIASQPEVDVL